jgi:hypothetical protein
VPNQARVYDCWLGGKENFAADRSEAARLLAIYPPLKDMVKENRAFIAEAVTWAANEAAKALNGQLRTYKHNGKWPPDMVLRQAAAEYAAAVPWTAADLDWLLAAAGPEVAAAVRAEVGAVAGSAACAGAAGRAPSVLLSVTEAAAKAGVSDRAIRAACAAKDKLAASKSRVSGEWRITPEALDEWMRRRRRAA